MMKKERFGFAVETIVAPGNPWHTHPLDYPEALGSFAALRRIREHFGALSVYVFSLVSEEAEFPRRIEMGKVLGWFAFHRFTERTGIPTSQILFCTKGEELALCRGRKSTCFVGTDLPVLDLLSAVERRFLFFPCGGVRPRLKQHPGIELIESWRELTLQLGLPEEAEDDGVSKGATSSTSVEVEYVTSPVPSVALVGYDA